MFGWLDGLLDLDLLRWRTQEMHWIAWKSWMASRSVEEGWKSRWVSQAVGAVVGMAVGIGETTGAPDRDHELLREGDEDLHLIEACHRAGIKFICWWCPDTRRIIEGWMWCERELCACFICLISRQPITHFTHTTYLPALLLSNWALFETTKHSQ